MSIRLLSFPCFSIQLLISEGSLLYLLLDTLCWSTSSLSDSGFQYLNVLISSPPLLHLSIIPSSPGEDSSSLHDVSRVHLLMVSCKLVSLTSVSTCHIYQHRGKLQNITILYLILIRVFVYKQRKQWNINGFANRAGNKWTCYSCTHWTVQVLVISSNTRHINVRW